jgi:hypothetical protein
MRRIREGPVAPRTAITAFVFAAGLVAQAKAQEASTSANLPPSAPPPAGQALPAAAADNSAVDPATLSKIAAWRAEIEAASLRQADWLACVRARRFQCESKPNRMDELLNDSTLIAGDIVATPHGLKIFQGRSTTPHSWADFR